MVKTLRLVVIIAASALLVIWTTVAVWLLTPDTSSTENQQIFFDQETTGRWETDAEGNLYIIEKTGTRKKVDDGKRWAQCGKVIVFLKELDVVIQVNDNEIVVLSPDGTISRYTDQGREEVRKKP